MGFGGSFIISCQIIISSILQNSSISLEIGSYSSTKLLWEAAIWLNCYERQSFFNKTVMNGSHLTKLLSEAVIFQQNCYEMQPFSNKTVMKSSHSTKLLWKAAIQLNCYEKQPFVNEHRIHVSKGLSKM